MTPRIIKSLFKTKFFNDIIIKRKDNNLILVFDERPTIVDIEFEGLEDIEPEQLDKILDAANIASGRIYDSSALERIRSELREQNFARGIYSVDIDIQETMLPDNRIYLNVVIKQGVRAKIKQIKIVGNKSFSDNKLKKEFQTALPVWYMFWSDSGVYSSPVLMGDINRLYSFYQDKGYMDFTVESTQVSLSKNKEEVYITISVLEGQQYIINKINVAGKLIIPIEEIAELITINTGDYFSRGKILESTEYIKSRLSEEGYAFAKINAMPEKNEKTNEVEISFYVDPGYRAYVRRINITGNITTQDQVYRRELRQMEGGWYSLNAIEISKSRLKRLAFVENVEFEEIRVQGSSNKIDLNIRIKEKLSGSFNVGAGFGGSGTGLSLSAGISQDNFLGLGSKVSLTLNTAKTNKVYAFNFNNPYHNMDNVSRSFGFSFTQTKTDNTDTVADYEADRIDFQYAYGIPFNENARFNLSLGFNKNEIVSTESSSNQIKDFIAKNGDSFGDFSLKVAYLIDQRDSSRNPKSGFKASLSTQVNVPGSDLKFYKVRFKTDSYFLINKEKDVVLRIRGITDYGQGYDGTDGLPFFSKFMMGGPKSVRGYEKNSLSPRDSADRPIGGDFAVLGSAEIIFNPPLDIKNLRTAFFADFGRSFDDYDNFEFGDLKGSVGLSIKWISPFGGVNISISAPLNDDSNDRTEGFQFNLGSG
jgi:outer membrane protein insertion porin family